MSTVQVGGELGGALPMMRSEVQCIMGNGHVGPTHEQTEIQTHMTENITFPQLRWRVVMI